MSEKAKDALTLADELMDGMSDEHWNQLKADAAALLRTQHADIDRKDALLMQALVAIEAQTSPKWECNSNHPKLHDALKAIRKELQ